MWLDGRRRRFARHAISKGPVTDRPVCVPVTQRLKGSPGSCEPGVMPRMANPPTFNSSTKRTGVFDGFGHYEDELVKVNGKWLFTKRKIYNEGRDEWAYKGGKNPAW